MPRLSCWFIRAALLHLAVGVLLGGLILAGKGLPIQFAWAWLLLPAHIQMLIGGWLIQLTLGMAYWILPRLSATGDRGGTAWAWISFGALNSGVGGAAALLIARMFWQAAWLDALLVLAALLQAIALVAFARHAWPRVQPIIGGTARQTTTP